MKSLTLTTVLATLLLAGAHAGTFPGDKNVKTTWPERTVTEGEWTPPQVRKEEQDSAPLPSWNDSPAKQAIMDFVRRAVEPGGEDFIPPAERIAVFDNDGTLWSEQPMYTQMFFTLDRIKALAPLHPEWREQEPFASVLRGDVAGALAGGVESSFRLVLAAHAGMTEDEFARIAREWFATLQMLQLTASGSRPGLAVLIHHTDGKREWAYDRQSRTGRLDRALDEAIAKGWVIVDMAKDWSVVFGGK